ncbi:MAG: hypothetical protein ACRERD_01140, partial [Candidatus Binatia bacterium]
MQALVQYCSDVLSGWRPLPLLLLGLLLATACPAHANDPPPSSPGNRSSIDAHPPQMLVPDEYQALYEQLEADLDSFEQIIASQWQGERYPVIFGTELAVASSNRGEELLEPGVVETIPFNLDRFQELGVTGVTVAINYPVLTPDFPRYSEYLAFYERVVQEIRSRGMKLTIQQGVILPSYSDLPVDYSDLTLATYLA